MIRLLERLIRLKKGKGFSFHPDLDSAALRALLGKLGTGLSRGALRRPFFLKAGGVPLFGKGVRLRNAGRIEIGRNFIAEDYCEIQGLSRHGLVFGNNITVGSMAMIRPSGYYGNHIGDGLRMGDGSNIGAYSYIGCAGMINIGKNVMMGPRVSLLAEQHVFEDTGKDMKSQGVRSSGIVIEDDCWLGAGVMILDGVTIGTGSIVAAGAVVTKSVEPYSIVGGVPAKLIRSRGNT